MREAEPRLIPVTLILGLTTAIGACFRDGEWKQAIQLLDEIRPLRGDKLPPAAAYAGAANACAKANEVDRARALIEELANAGGSNGNDMPTVECYGALILASAIAGDAKGAVHILMKDIPAAGLGADTKCVNRAITGCARVLEWELALGLLKELQAGE